MRARSTSPGSTWLRYQPLAQRVVGGLEPVERPGSRSCRRSTAGERLLDGSRAHRARAGAEDRDADTARGLGCRDGEDGVGVRVRAAHGRGCGALGRDHLHLEDEAPGRTRGEEVVD